MITDDNGRRIFALEIGGLSIRYLSDNVDVSSSNLDSNLTTGIAYSNVEAISGVGSYQADIDPAGGIANYSPLTVTLSTSRLRGTSSDPHVVFGRCGPRSTDVQKAQVSTSIYHDFPSVVINVDYDFTSLSFPRVMHIGAETVRVLSATSSTLTIDTRGVGRTPIQNHVSTLGGTNVPEIFTEIISFRGRKASLYMAQRRPDGSISDFTEIINGFIESSPSIEDNTVNLSLVPLTALIDNIVSEASIKTSLVHDYHNFSNQGSLLEYGVVCIDSDPFVFNGSTGSPTLTIASVDNPLDLPNAFDPSLDPSNNGTYYIHPRYPELINSEGRLFPHTVTTSQMTYDNGNFSYNTLMDSTVKDRRVKVLTPRAEIKSYQITQGVQRFPQIINDVLDANQTGLATGTDGSWLEWNIADDTGLSIKSNVNKTTADCNILFFSSRSALRQFEEAIGVPPVGIWNDTQSGGYYTEDLNRLYYPLDLWGFQGEGRNFPDDPTVQHGSNNERPNQFYALWIGPDQDDQSKRVDIKGIAKAYYQNGEPTILVQDDLGLPSSYTAGVSYDIEVNYYDRRRDEQLIQVFPISHQTTASYSGTDVGYLLHIVPPFASSLRSSFGDWDGYEPTEIYLSTRLRSLTPGQAILRLLQSGGGGTINGAYDVSSIGLNLDQSEIDVNSFLQYESIPNLTIDLDLRAEGSNFRDILTPLLQTMGAVLVMRRTRDGRSKIALQPMGMDQVNAANITINEGDWLSNPPPTWDTYEDIVTQVEVKFDYDVIEEKLRTVRSFNNQEAINRYGGERSKISLDLYGVSSSSIGSSAGDSFSYFLPVVSRIFNLLSNPLRVWRGSIGTGKSALIDIGRYALVSSPLLKGYSPEYGVTNGVGFIRSIRQELMSEGCEVEILSSGSNTASWHDSGRVSAIVNTTTVYILEGAFAETNLIGEDVKASDFFKVGDIVDYLPKGDHDNAITGLEIASISRGGTFGTIEFTSTHGISAIGGTLEPTLYTSASTDQKVDAYISNTSGILGTSDEGKEYA